MKTLRDSVHKASGFTLIEVNITMALLAMLVPAVLMSTSMLAKMSQRGINRNEAISEACIAQQKFIGMVNASGLNLRVQNGGNRLLIERYDEGTQTWGDAALEYIPSKSLIVYYPDAESSSYSVFANSIHLNGTQTVFSIERGGIRCSAFVGQSALGKQKKLGNLIMEPGVYLNVLATPYNKRR